MAHPAQCLHCSSSMPPRARYCPGCGRSQDAQAKTITEDRATASTLPTVPQRLLTPRTRVGDFTIDEVIGEGGMGVVYRATDNKRNQTVALKALHGSLMGDQGITRRFMREARVMTRWSHPNLVQVFELIEHEDLLAFAMEYVEGPTLESYIDQWGGQLPYDEVRAVFSGVLDAMSAAHTRGIVHRDLKPQNILLEIVGETITAKVADFGVAKVLEGTAYTMTGALIGSCRYMSPEQVQSDRGLDQRSDIYSLGVTLYRALAGRCPFETENHFALMMAHVRQEPAPPSRYRVGLPEPLEALVMETLAKDPDKRPPSCADLRKRLLAALDTIAPRRETRSKPAQRVVLRDESELLLVPAGIYQAGLARREIYLDAHYLARTPVTNRQFAEFLRITGYQPDDDDERRFLGQWHKGMCPSRLLDHPVVCVSWKDANAYCSWAGGRLPTEAEWEKSARGPEGFKYPWGKTEPTRAHANFGRATAGTSEVTAHGDGASPYGMLDMAGNVWEWCEDVDEPEFYLSGPPRNPRNTAGAPDAARVVRGGSWMFDARALRTHTRSSFAPDFRIDSVGFRLAL